MVYKMYTSTSLLLMYVPPLLPEGLLAWGMEGQFLSSYTSVKFYHHSPFPHHLFVKFAVSDWLQAIYHLTK
jgi:hypothetical protein